MPTASCRRCRDRWEDRRGVEAWSISAWSEVSEYSHNNAQYSERLNIQTCLWMEWSGVRVNSTPLQWILAGVDSSTGVHWSPVEGVTLPESYDHRLNPVPRTQILFALVYVGYAWHVSDQSASRHALVLALTGVHWSTGVERPSLHSSPIATGVQELGLHWSGLQWSGFSLHP
jgi:hypothetical protein